MASGFVGAARRAVVMTALATSLAACATAAQREFQAIKANNGAASQQLQTCVATVYNDPAVAPLRRHLPLNVTDATVEQLADTSLATNQETQAIESAYPRYHECRRQYLSQISSTTPSLIPIYIAAYNNTQDQVVNLIKRQVSWGEFLRRIRQIDAEAAAQVSAESQRLVATLNRSHEAELARRQAAADAMAIVGAMNRPVMTNCNNVGPFINCMNQ